jgi:electron transfer flavoprotein alpha subunit
VSRLAVVPVRDGVVPAGGLEAVAECDGHAFVVGHGVQEAAVTLAGVTRATVRAWETPGFRPGAWAAALAAVLGEHDVVVLPGSPDGRDLAPRLAAALGRPLLAGALRVDDHGAEVVRQGGLVIEDIHVAGPFVATLQPGVRGVERHGDLATVSAVELPIGDEHDAGTVNVLPPDAATMDLSEAPRIVGGGAGLDSAARFVQLAAIARALDASMGATRVVTDRGWVEHARQIGTTGVVVDPRLYLAFGISGAVQHTSGLGAPAHIVSVNTEPHCPMMQLADLPIVADANAVLDELERRLSVTDER